MAIFEFTNVDLQRVPRASLADASIWERRDLQRIFRNQLSELLPDVLVIAEEFGDWDRSKRRIDLLALDRNANLVVIELKRGDTGEHMELQAVRYAAMVSTMTFDQAVATYETHLGADAASDARTRILEFLDWEDVVDDDFAQDVRIVLFSEDFSRELTSSVLWLNEKGIAITCFRMRGYTLHGRLLLDIQQIIPLQEAEEYQVRVRNKQFAEQSSRRERVPWNGELYANYGDPAERSWEDARKYGFISAGGKEWFSRTLRLLVPGKRVWVNRPGLGYIGVGIVVGQPVIAEDFMVETPSGTRRYLDVGKVGPALRANASDAEKADRFVPVRWIKTVDESAAIRSPGFFGNQNSAAQPTTPTWPTTVASLKLAFDIAD